MSNTKPSDSVILLSHMPQQAHVWTMDDDWTGTIDRQERRRLQNRQNQRAYRQRRKQHSPPPSSSDPMFGILVQSRPATPPTNHIQPATQNEPEDFKCGMAPPDVLTFQRWFEAVVHSSYLRNSPQIDHLIGLTRLNVHRAIRENIAAIGMTVDWMNSDDSLSIFNIGLPGFTEDGIPTNLRPTAIQRWVPHHPWLDFFPFPGMRDRLILAGDTFDEDELCHDLMAFWDTRNSGATLLVWGQAWDAASWEVTEEFARKWAWLLRGSPELLLSTNSWRLSRGEKPLVWKEILL
ncbi:hypothetical protein BDV25DRAFT_126064 [Aspergillus avenaceus]|uniref:BZIP domain-containing protein n=1 Tax=Aspergillus avenaceus TaxID=36643 RepID=A0A5N6U926_ASPAV|nr:hypothetical protein BDV25DRAFT_126064 [Aspergillus avenaceus]